MKKQDKTRFAKVMAVLAEIFDQGQEPSEFKIELYFQALAEYEIKVIERAAAAITKTRVYPAFPKPGEIIQEIQGTASNQATMAWLDVLSTVKRIGNYQSVKFSDPVIHGVIEAMGGWIRLAGEMTADEEKWKQKEFERLYEILSKYSRSFSSYLPGLCEIQNAVCGYEGKADIVNIGADRLQIPTEMKQAAQEG